LFQSVEGTVDSVKFIEAVTHCAKREGRTFEAKRYFCDQDELIHSNKRTCALTNQWGKRTGKAIEELLNAFPDKGVSFKISDRI
jgi:hypothetical protein